MEFTKPECRSCKEDSIPAEFAENLAYHIFNPYAMDRGNFNVKNFIKQKISDEELAENFDSYSAIFNDMMRNFGYAEALWMDKFEKYVEAKSKAWEEIKEKLRSGELKVEDINFKELLDYFFEEALKELIEMGIIEGVTKRFFRRKVKFSRQAERIIAQKVMKEVSKEAKGYYAESEGETLSYIPGYELVEYDEYLHSYDLIDIPETMIRAAKNEDFEIREKEHSFEESQESRKETLRNAHRRERLDEGEENSRSNRGCAGFKDEHKERIRRSRSFRFQPQN